MAVIDALAVVTKDRPQSLTACLESYLQNCQQHGRSPEFLIADDSAGCGGCTKTALKGLAQRFTAPLRYAGRHDKRRFADALARESGVAQPTIDFALFGDPRCPITTGANRNAVLLDTLGTCLLSVDDDTVCRVASAPVDLTVLHATVTDPTEFWFYPGAGAHLAEASFVDVDVLHCHERYLGREGVALTLSGRLGDCAMDSPRHYFTLTGESRERFLSAYRSALLSRECLRTVRQPTITTSPVCMMTFVGLDNRTILPPFFSVQRNADAIFGLMQLLCTPYSHTAFLPWSLLHAPEPVRVFDPTLLASEAGMVRLCDLVLAAVLSHRWRADAVTTADRLVDLGRHLSALGRMPSAECDARLRIPHQLRRIAFLGTLERQLQTYGDAPGVWAHDVRRLFHAVSQAIEDPKPLSAQDLPDPSLTQSLISRFGDVLQAWPTLVEATRRLKAKGTRVSEAIS